MNDGMHWKMSGLSTLPQVVLVLSSLTQKAMFSSRKQNFPGSIYSISFVSFFVICVSN